MSRRVIEDERRLPQWAQRKLAALRANVDHYKAAAFAATGTFEGHDSDTAVITYEGPGHRYRCLPPGTTIAFNLGIPGGVPVEVQVTRKPNGSVEVYTTQDALSVVPRSSNVVGIHVVKWPG